MNKHHLPSAIEEWGNLSQKMLDKQPILLLDYDGTLMPIASKPNQVLLTENKKRQIEYLSKHYLTIIISGRLLEEQMSLVNIENVYHIANHGYEVNFPLELNYKMPKAIEFIDDIHQAYTELNAILGKIKGIYIEYKKYTLSVHFRLVEKNFINYIESTVDNIVNNSFKLRKFYSNKVFEIRPNLNWDTDAAFLLLIQTLGLDKNKIFPICIGDDITDEPTFGSLKNLGASILVSKHFRPTFADYSLKNTDEVWLLLNKLAKNQDVSKNNISASPSEFKNKNFIHKLKDHIANTNDLCSLFFPQTPLLI